MGQIGWRKDSEFFSSLIVIQVESYLFSVLRKPFVDASPVFRNMLELPKVEGTVCDGTDEAHPLLLDGIKNDEFRAFLKALYMPKYHHLSGQDLSVEEWLSVMKLARMWDFDELREQALKKLNVCSIDAIRRIQLARTYELSGWIHKAFSELVEREDSLTDEEVERLGSQDALKVARIRERKLAKLVAHYRTGHPRIRRCERGHEEIVGPLALESYCRRCPLVPTAFGSLERMMIEVINDGCDKITFDAE